MKENSTIPNAQLKTILWIALFVSNFIYLGIILFIPRQSSEALETNSMIVMMLSFMSLMMVGMSFVIPKLIKSTEENQASEFSKFVLSLALNESASIFAFIIGFIFNEDKFAFVLFAISLGGFILKFPKGKNVSNQLNAE